ncbi:MAG: DUF4345 family protein, partial [Chromatiales bacterium]|nr:DUF4345 family protein [Chromatiales bacterium]
MTPFHKMILCGLLLFLGISLLFPGGIELFRLQAGIPGLEPAGIDALNHFRTLHGMMTGLGIVALWACWNIEQSPELLLGLAVIIA